MAYLVHQVCQLTFRNKLKTQKACTKGNGISFADNCLNQKFWTIETRQFNNSYRNAHI